MKIAELSITDLKAAYDFTELYLKKLEKQAVKIGTIVREDPPYKKIKSLKDKLYSELANRIQLIK